MVNQSVNKFYTRFLFKTYTLSQDVAFQLDISGTFFNNLSPDVINLLISEGVQVTPRPSTENNHQGNQRLLLVRNASVESENKTRTIKAAVKPSTGIRHTKTFMGMLAEIPSTQISGLGSSFQSKESNSMVAEAMEKYAFISSEAAYEDPGEHATMGFMDEGGGFHDVNASHWCDQKNP